MTPPSPIHRTSSAATAAAWFLGLYGLLEFVPGLVHFLLPDGGARVIAGLDLAHHGHVIIGVFAWVGAVQIAHGLGLLAVAAWCRPLVPVFLALALLERLLMSVAAWVTKPSPTGHHPPEHYASPLLVPLLALFLALAIRGRHGRHVPMASTQSRG